MSANKREQIPMKNYIYLGFILLATILVLFYAYRWYETYKEEMLNTGIMNNYLTVINYNELDDYITENKDAIIYVSILGNNKINKFDFNFDEMTINKMIYKGKDNPVYKRIPYSLYLCN